MMSAWAWNKTLHSGVICHLGDEGGSLGSSCLEKVKVYKLGGGERSSDQAVGSTPPEQSAKWEGEEAAILKERAAVGRRGLWLHLSTSKPGASSCRQAPVQQV